MRQSRCLLNQLQEKQALQSRITTTKPIHTNTRWNSLSASSTWSRLRLRRTIDIYPVRWYALCSQLLSLIFPFEIAKLLLSRWSSCGTYWKWCELYPDTSFRSLCLKLIEKFVRNLFFSVLYLLLFAAKRYCIHFNQSKKLRLNVSFTTIYIKSANRHSTAHYRKV